MLLQYSQKVSLQWPLRLREQHGAEVCRTVMPSRLAGLVSIAGPHDG
jgi:hypothetical protein